MSQTEEKIEIYLKLVVKLLVIKVIKADNEWQTSLPKKESQLLKIK